MSILTHDAIIELLRSGQLEISPFDERQVGPASIDLHVDNRFRVFKEVRRPFDVTEDADLNAITEELVVAEGDSLMLMPGKSCLGITVERIHLPDNLAGWLQGRSRFARLGLVVHATASLVQPGVNNRQVLELTNTGQIPLNIIPQVAIAQLILQTCVGQARYAGRYGQQIAP
jgi:dCTP deaminase